MTIGHYPEHISYNLIVQLTLYDKIKPIAIIKEIYFVLYVT